MIGLSFRVRLERNNETTRGRAAHCIALIVVALALLVPTLPIAAAPIGGTLMGNVVMKTAGVSLPSAPLAVTLLYVNTGLFRDEATPESRTTTTAPDGSFSFVGLDTSSAGVYRVIVQYKGIAYEPAEHDASADAAGGTGKSRAVRFPNNAPTVSTEVPIYEPAISDNPANLAIKTHQVIINEVRPQFYSTLEALQITNPGDRTLVGALNPDGSVAQGVLVTYSVPANAQTIGTNRTDLIPGADLTNRKLTFRVPIQPGTNDVEATYDMPGTPSGLVFQRTLDYAAPKVQVLVSDARQVVFSTTLKDDGPIQASQGAIGFRQFSLDNAQAGQTIALTIGPSPPATTRATPATPQKSAFTQWRERLTVPFLLVLAVVCLLLMVAILRTPVRAPGEANGSAGRTRSGRTPPSATEGSSDATESDTDETPTPTMAGGRGKPSLQPVRRTRGRPPDYELDEAERAIEEANEAETHTPTER